MNHATKKLQAPSRGKASASGRPYSTTWVKTILSTIVLPLAFGLFLTSVAPLHAQERQSVSKVAPVYPELAKRMHITGTIRVIATVDANGAVLKAESDSGNKMLAPAAIDAVKRWKFAPGEGHSTVTVQVVFEL